MQAQQQSPTSCAQRLNASRKYYWAKFGEHVGTFE